MNAGRRFWGIISLCLSLLVGLILAANHYEWSVTRILFLNKSLWDWTGLLIVPVMLAVIAVWFQQKNTHIEREIAQQRYEQDQQISKQRYEQDQKISLDKQREDLLQAYLDRLSELLLEKNLRSSQQDAEVRNVARSRTLTVLRQLDAHRKRSLIEFLSESKLLGIISLSGAELHDADLRYIDLSRADLKGAKLKGTNLSQADLSGADLAFTDLSHANLEGADLSDAFMSGANLRNLDLTSTRLTNAFLEDADMEGTIINDYAKNRIQIIL